ncbi:hypothetical protein ACHAPX_002609 [Trichoderma viride]
MQMGIQACRIDDVSLMAQVLSVTAHSQSRDKVQRMIQLRLQTCLRRRSHRVLSYLLDNGADISDVHPGWLYSDYGPFAKPSLEALEILIAHGWDIDSRRGGTSWPLLWGVVQFPDLVEWCLDHGASVYLPGDTPPIAANGEMRRLPRITLLESAAGDGSVAIFKLLREKGAPFHPRVLHAAVERAVVHAPFFDDSTSHRRDHFNERMVMIRYLVDEVGIDVCSQWWKVGRIGATPLEYVAHHTSSSDKDVRDLIWFLLDRGADPNRASVIQDGYKGYEDWIYKGPDFSYASPLEVAQQSSRPHVLEAIQEWQRRQRSSATWWTWGTSWISWPFTKNSS